MKSLNDICQLHIAHIESDLIQVRSYLNGGLVFNPESINLAIAMHDLEFTLKQIETLKSSIEAAEEEL